MTHRPQIGYKEELPIDWEVWTDQQKHDWFVRRRVYQQAIRQDTSFGRAHTRAIEKAKEDRSGKGPNVPSDEDDKIEGVWIRDAQIEAADNDHHIDGDLQ